MTKSLWNGSDFQFESDWPVRHYLYRGSAQICSWVNKNMNCTPLRLGKLTMAKIETEENREMTKMSERERDQLVRD